MSVDRLKEDGKYLLPSPEEKYGKYTSVIFEMRVTIIGFYGE